MLPVDADSRLSLLREEFPVVLTEDLIFPPDLEARLEQVVAERQDRQSTRLNSITNAQLVCRLLLEKKKQFHNTHLSLDVHTRKHTKRKVRIHPKIKLTRVIQLE